MIAINAKRYKPTKAQILKRSVPKTPKANRYKMTRAQLLKRKTGIGKRVSGKAQRSKPTKAQILKNPNKWRPKVFKPKPTVKPVVKPTVKKPAPVGRNTARWR